MKKYLLVLFCLPMLQVLAQNTKGRWNEMFSYGNVKFIEEVQGVLYCATENGIFVYDSAQIEGDWTKYNKTNVLSNVGISSMDYDAQTNTLMIGYDNGAIDLLVDGESQIVLDIPWNNFTGSKKINHIFIEGNLAIISGNFGLASYNLTTREFLETTFFYENGNYKAVNEAAIYNNRIYALTNNGVYTYPLVNGTNYPNFYAWQTVPNTSGINGLFLEIFNQELYFSSRNQLYKINAANQLAVIRSFDYITDLKVNDEVLSIAENHQVNFMSQNGTVLTKNIPYQEISSSGNVTNTYMNLNTGIVAQNRYFGGTKNHGLVDFELAADYFTNPNGYKPDGPYSNESVSLTVKNNKVWIAPGAMSDYNAPSGNASGFFYFDKFKWNHFKSKDLLGAKDFVKIAVNPTDDNHFVAVPYFEYPEWNSPTRIGIFEFKQQGETFSTSHIYSPFQWIYRTGGAEFDENGDLYVSSSFPGIPDDAKANYYYQRKGQSWRSSQISRKVGPSTALSPQISSNYVWFPNAREGGLTVLNKNMEEVATLTRANSNIYNDAVLTVAIDQNNSVWIGTLLGITVLNGGDAAIAEGNYNTEPIVIIQDGIPEALLTNIRVNDIKVDKANRKWIATHSSGVYYVSDNGEQTIYHFTSKNSPLPSDTIYDIDIDDTTGKVYFATEKGVVVFNGDVQEVGDKFNKVLAYPNPVRPGFKGNVIIKNIPNRASVKITDVTGNLIYEAKANGGIIEWNTKNNIGKDVASGVYIVLMTNADGTETKTLKIAVVR